MRPLTRCCLCLRSRELEESHLIPAGMYRISRGDPHGNPNPLLLSPDMFLQTSDQVKDYLLCHDCEELFNKNGERWVIAHCYREKDGAFKFREYLRNEVPFIS